ncbi:MAG: DNA-binding protein [Betaproteobacteria bacterium]|nr:DNA-binding protein [Betaproteobacteria bacterium]
MRDVIPTDVTLRYDYAPSGEVAGRFMAGLKEGRILATRCSRSGLTYVPPRSFCERTFEKCDAWVEAGVEGVIETSAIVGARLRGEAKAPVAIAFVRASRARTGDRQLRRRPDFEDYVTRIEAHRARRGWWAEFAEVREGRVTDFSFVCID